MFKKIFLFSFIFALMIGLAGAAPRLTKAQLDRISRMEYKLKVVGDAVVGESVGDTHIPGKLPTSILIKGNAPLSYSPNTWISSITYSFTGCTSIYDLVSNGSPDNIIQDPNAPDKIHVSFVTNPPGDPDFANRRSKYYYSTNRGVSWSFVSDVPNGIRSGFPTIRLFSDGTEIIANHSGAGTITTVRTQWFKDAFAGLGSYTRLDHPYIGVGYIWPRFACSNSITSPNKFVDVSSISGQDSAYRTSCTNFSIGTGVFTPWTIVNNAVQAETYKVAYGADGRVGIVYNATTIISSSNIGDVFFIESSDGGTTFGTQTKIYDCLFTGDSLGNLRGISLVYIGNSPKVVFETVKLTQSNSYFPGANAKIRFWSTNLPGTDPNRSIVIADTNSVGFHPYISVGTNSDVFASLCRPVIGKSINDKLLFVAFSVPFGLRSRQVYVGGSPDTNAFMSVYMTASSDSGKHWFTSQRVTPADTVHIFDWTYPSISPTNDWNSLNGTCYANLSVFKDSVPGSYVNHPLNGESPNAGYYFMRVATFYVVIRNSSSEIPSSFSLSQNYPNPFNPKTKIVYKVASSKFIKLQIFDILGKEVSILVNEKQSPGTYEVIFDGSNLPSGIYFYRLVAGDSEASSGQVFSETKKMILIK